MSESHLNSIHLEPKRREHFRQARSALLEARGSHTMVAEQDDGDWSIAGSHTMVQDPRDVPRDVEFWLADQDGVYPLKVGVNTIGRLPDNDVVVHVPYISRRHCAILVHAGSRCELHDIASKNGTYLNGTRLAGPTKLHNGDQIRICDREFRFLTRKGDDPELPGHGHTMTL